MALLPRIQRRDRIPTTIYEDNYGYTINSYQPMIDYLDAKRIGEKPQYPHLPFTNERALPKYWSRSLVKTYTSADAKTYSKEISNNAKTRQRNLDDYKVIKRISPLSVTKSALGARLDKQLQLPTVEEKLLRKQREREDIRRIADIMNDVEHIKARFNADKHVEISSGLKNAIRGKTASQITAAILAESEKNIRQSKNREQLAISRAKQERCSSSEGRYVTRTTRTYEITNNHDLDKLDSSMCTELHGVTKQLHNFNQRAEHLYQQSRWRRRLFY